MVFKGSLYLLNILCGLMPCDHKFSYPDTTVTDPHALARESEYDSDSVGGNSIEVDWEDGMNKTLLGNGTHPLLLISVSTGMIKGFWMNVVGGRKIRAFEGIPYAEPPIDKLRFKAPVPKKEWIGVFHADLKGPKCLQFNQISTKRVIGSENCLYLNVYTPKHLSKTRSGKHPVLIYIHGGGFMTGSGNDFGPAYLLQRDIILVTINYRLGVLGFMSTNNEESPGNYGLKDQSEAIKWVYKNIHHFDGDPTKITLFGHGAGGSSVHFQMISFKARGFFHGGISISGTAFNQWAIHTPDQAYNLTKSFAKALHCPIRGSIAESMECMRSKRGSDLVKMQLMFLDKWPVTMSLFRPVVEAEYQKEDPFLTETPEEAYEKGTVDKMPWICGIAEDEGYTFLVSHISLGTFAKLRRNWNSLAPDFLNYNDLPVDQDEITRRINWLYFSNSKPSSAPVKTYSSALGARFINTGVHKALQAHSQHAETYAFVFGYNGKYNLAVDIKPSEWAVGHGEILGYILNTTTYPGFQRTDSSELMLSKILVNFIYNFADKQVPGYTTDKGRDFHVWNSISDPRNMSFLQITKRIKMIPEPYLNETLFWLNLGLPDSLPLANFSEPQNGSDANSTGFVSTDITKTGMTVPDGLRPPLKSEVTTYATYATTETPEITSTPDTTDTTTPPSAPDSTTTPTPISTSLPATIWLAQIQSPILPIAKMLEEATTTPEAPEPSTAGTTTENAFPTWFPPNTDNSIEPQNNLPRGISIPIISGDSNNSSFITKSNITRDFLTKFGIARRYISEMMEAESSDPDEMMIAAA